MTAPIRPRQRITRTQYEAARAEGYSDAEIRSAYDVEGGGSMYNPHSAPHREAEPKGNRSGARGALTQFAQGMTLGGLDELAPTMGATLYPWNAGKSAEQVSDEIRTTDRDYAKANPGTAMLARLAGAVVPAIVTGNALGVGTSAARMAAEGAGFGAVQGSNEAEDGQRLRGGLTGGAVGAIAGPLIGKPVAALAERMAPQARSAANLARRIVGKSARAEIPTPERAKERALAYAGKAFRKDGGDLMAELRGLPALAPDDPSLLLNRGGRSVQSAARVAQAVPSDATQTVPAAIYAQLEQGPARIQRDLQRAIGKPLPNPQARLGELADDAAKAAKPYYDAIGDEVMGDEALQAIVDRPAIADALKTARTYTKNRGRAAPELAPANAPTPDVPTPSGKPPKPNQSPRGLWLTAKTERGALHKAETVETEGLIDDLLRRQELDRYYHQNPRKYGPTSAVTLRNQDAIGRVLDVLEKRDGIDFERAHELVAARKAAHGEWANLQDFERVVYAPPKDPTSALPAAAATPDAPEPQAFLVSELDDAKKILDARIEDLSEKIANGIDASTSAAERGSLMDAREALLAYMDEMTAGRYAHARGVAQQGIQQREAFRAGTKYPSTSENRLTYEQAPRSDAEKDRVLEGAAVAMDEVIGKTPDRRNLAARFFGSPAERQKLDLVTQHRPDAQATLRRGFRREDQLRQQATRALVDGQSMTTPLREAVDDFTGATSGQALSEAARFLSGGWGTKAVMALAKAKAKMAGLNAEAASELGRLLTLNRNASVEEINAYVRALQQRQARQALAGARGNMAARLSAASTARSSR